MEILIGQDIRKYKTKDIGNFSFKEAAFLAAGAAVGFLTYKLTGSIEIAIPPAGLICSLVFQTVWNACLGFSPNGWKGKAEYTMLHQ